MVTNRFEGVLDVRIHGLRRYQLLSEIKYFVTENDAITVPKGFETDLATVPRILWAIFPPVDRYVKAAVLHDYMYENALRTKKEADRIFLEAMRVLEVGYIKRYVMYWAVRFFGRGNYKESAM